MVTTKKATADLPELSQLLPGMDVELRPIIDQNTGTPVGMQLTLLLMHKLHEIIAFFILGKLK